MSTESTSDESSEGAPEVLAPTPEAAGSSSAHLTSKSPLPVISKKRRWLKKGLEGALILAIAGLSLYVLASNVTEGKEIVDRLLGMGWELILGVTIAAIGTYVLNATTMSLPLPELSFFRGFISQHIGQAVGFVTPGPTGTAFRYVVSTSFGVTPERFASGAFTVAIWNTTCMLAMPGVAYLILAITGSTGKSAGHSIFLAVIMVAIACLSTGATVALLRSEKFARRIGTRIGKVIIWYRAKRKKPPATTDYGQRLVELRADAVADARKRGWRLTAMVVANYWVTGLILVFCLRGVGVTPDDLGWIPALALYSIGRLSTLIMITPGGIGVAEVAYTAAYVSVLGAADQAAIIAAVIVFRFYTYFVPIVIGAVSYVIWRVMRWRGVVTLAAAEHEPA